LAPVSGVTTIIGVWFQCGDEIGDAGPVLANAHGDLTVGTRVPVGHMGGALLVGDIHETDPGALEDVETGHEGRAHDTEGDLHPVDPQRLHERFM
jgi:hypothetical protein